MPRTWHSRYDSAARAFTETASGPKTLALKAAAFGGLATTTTDVDLRRQYVEVARSSLDKSILTSRGTKDQSAIIEFARGTPTLAQFLPQRMEKKGPNDYRQQPQQPP